MGYLTPAKRCLQKLHHLKKNLHPTLRSGNMFIQKIEKFKQQFGRSCLPNIKAVGGGRLPHARKNYLYSLGTQSSAAQLSLFAAGQRTPEGH